MKQFYDFYINGEWVSSQQPSLIEIINPSDESAVGILALGSQEDTNQAVLAAKQAFSSWSVVSKQEKLSYFEKLLKIYEQRHNIMAQKISTEMGCPIDMSTASQAQASCGHIKNIIAELQNFSFEKNYLNQVSKQETNNHLIHEPIGICALITPWNWPMSQITLKVLPALAVGCTVVLKPSELAPLSGLYFAQMIHDAGFPKGVFNLVNGDGAGVGTWLSQHPDIDMVSFTGSTKAGRLVSINATESIKRVSLELGGKGANLVFADAVAGDWKKAIKWSVRQCFSNSGQSCNAPTRLLVEQDIYAEAVQVATDIAQQVMVDIASKSGSHIGPVISQLQFQKIQKLIQIGIDEGARLLVGGLGKPSHLPQGYFVKPTIFADVAPDMQIAQQEIFGPVLTIMSFQSEQDAINMANNTPYGLTNYIQSSDLQRCQKIARQLRSGMVELNGEYTDTGAPFGGYKQSGNGREGGAWGMQEFLEVKVVSGWLD